MPVNPNTHQTIKQDGITGATVNRLAICSTGAGTTTKTASIGNGTFSLESGAQVLVKFNNANTANSPTLNINGKGAKQIYYKGAQITSGNEKNFLNGVCLFVYDGTRWHLVENYVHPAYTSQESGLYKFAVDTTGHVSSTTTITKADITGLGIPGENTTYTVITSGSGNAVTTVTLSGTQIIATKGATYNNYTHPSYTSHESGLYKITVNETGHVSAASTVTKKDITDLGIPEQDTTYSVTTTGSGNAVTAVTLSGTTITVNKDATYNNYTHPAYTSQESGIYKITIDETGHVSAASAATAADIGAAAATHSHGNITSDGKVGTASNKALYTGTSGTVTSGTLPVAAGGTGMTTGTSTNAVVITNSSTATGAMQTISSKSGAFYSTGTNTKPQFGTLPIAQGGTGATTASEALTALGGSSGITIRM